jgi:single-stranded DNA-binding protein
MPRGMTMVVVLGNVVGRPGYSATGNETPVCTFDVLSERHGHGRGDPVVVRSKINVYGEGLVAMCHRWLFPNTRVQVSGELMNREGKLGLLIEIRAKEIVFLSKEG